MAPAFTAGELRPNPSPSLSERGEAFCFGKTSVGVQTVEVDGSEVRSPLGASLGSLYPTGSSLGSLGHPPTSITIADSAVVPRDEISIACDKSVCHSSCGPVARRPVGAKEVRFSEPSTKISLEETILGLGHAL